MAYNFYIQKHPQGNTKFPKFDLEKQFGAIYKSLTNSQQQEVKNVYIEDFAESSIQKTHVPAADERAFASTDCVLSLLFKSADCINKTEALWDYIGGQKIEFSDNFRGRYIELIPIKYTINQEVLYKGNDSYQLVDITCTKYDGRSHIKSQI